MDYYNASTAWFQNPAPAQQDRHLHAGVAQGGAENGVHGGGWKDGGAPAEGGPAGGAAQALEPIDFGLDDLPPGPSSATAPPTHASSYYYPTQSYYPVQQQQYGSVPYASSSWDTGNPSHLLSTYSTLNGAISPTTTTAPPQPPPQEPPRPTSSLMIDPSLTSLAAAANGHPYSHAHTPTHTHAASPPPAPVAHSPEPAPQQTQATAPYYIMPNGMYITPAFYANYLRLQQAQQAQQQVQTQGALSPAMLHSPVGPEGLPPSSFYAQAPAPVQQAATPQGLPTPAASPPVQQTSLPEASFAHSPPAPVVPEESPEVKRERLQTRLKPLLQPNSFSGAAAVDKLATLIDEFGAGAVDPALRLEILTKIRDNAPNHYFRAWSANEDAMKITQTWLQAGERPKNDKVKIPDGVVETIMPLLHIIDRLPLTVEALRKTSLGKSVRKFTKDPPAPAIKDMAANIEKRWMQLVTAAQGSAEKDAEDPKQKKRKQADAPASKPAPAKKQATGAPVKAAPPAAAAVAAAPMKRAAPAPTAAAKAAPTVKDAKADSSFFSQPKAKAKLPSFKKAPVPLAPVAQPSAVDPFKEALEGMRGRKQSPVTAVPTPPPAPATALPAPVAGAPGKSVKKKKSVTWAPDAQLEAVKLITPAVYPDDPDSDHPMHDIRDLERAEGAALHLHASFEESLDWSEPLLIHLPKAPDEPDFERGEKSQEKLVQEERETTALSASYMADSLIPDTPSDAGITILPDAEVDKEVVGMITGPEVDASFGAGAPPGDVRMASVSELVGQLAGSSGGAPPPLPPPNEVPPPGGPAFPNFSASALPIPNEQLQQLLAQAQALYGQGQPQQAPGFSEAPGAPAQYYPEGEQQHWNQGMPANQNQYGQQPYAPQGGSGGGDWDDGGFDRSDWSEGNRGRGGPGGGRGRGGRGRGGFSGNKRDTPCNFFRQGRCRYGDQCEFGHFMPSQGY